MGRNWRIALLVLGLLVFAALISTALASSTDTKAGYIIVGVPPSADFGVMYAYNTIPTTVKFVDMSTGSIPLTYQWDFGDGATSTDPNPSHLYIQKGSFTVTLTVTNTYGSSTARKVNAVSIGVQPVADFSADQTIGNVPFVVNFNDRSLGHPSTWNWNFGDGQGSNDQNPVHTYWVGGKFTVILTASNDYGLSDATKSEYIIVNPPLKSKFITDTIKGNAPLTVKFTDLSIGSPASWKWDFADGSTSTEQNPVHTFTTPGVYRVVLEVTRGTMSDKSLGIINVGGVPVTDFVADQTLVNPYDIIHFTDKTTNSPTKWLWNFGDGSESTEQNPVKAYGDRGVYTVSLWTGNENTNRKDQLVKVGYITVGVGPVANFIAENPVYQQSSSRLNVRFIDTSMGSPTSWLWNFGDGQTSTDQNPTHLYTAGGSYTVSLTVKNKFGEDTKIVSNLIDVGQGPKVDFSADKTVVNVGRIIRFTDLSTNSPTDWKWDFGDGTTGTGQNPDHAYRAIGVYDVTLTASNQYTALSQTKIGYISVTVNFPRADFVADTTKGQAPFQVQFTDLSKGKPTAWKWDFGDGSTTSDQNPAHKYTTNGVYTVSLTTTNANGQDTETKDKYIVVTQAPIANFKVDSRLGKAPFIVKFHDLSAGQPTKWYWEFGDGTTSADQNPEHSYAREGTYDVKLTVWNQYGSDSILKTGTTNEPLVLETPAPTPAPVTTTQVVVAATTAKPVATQAPLPLVVVIGALAISLIALVAGKRK